MSHELGPNVGWHHDAASHTWWFSYKRPGNRCLTLVWRAWEDVRILIDSYVQETWPCCGCIKDRGHAWACRKRKS